MAYDLSVTIPCPKCGTEVHGKGWKVVAAGGGYTEWEFDHNCLTGRLPDEDHLHNRMAWDANESLAWDARMRKPLGSV